MNCRAECGPELTEKDLKELYPFDDQFFVVEITGKELKECFDYLFSLKPDGTVMNGTFQYSIVSLSTFHDLARWFLAREMPVEAPPKGRFIFNNFDPATIKK